MNPLEGIAKPFKIYELRKRILFTLGMIAIYRVGSFIPTPGVNGDAFQRYFQGLKGSMVGLANLFTGGALERFSIFALGIMPFISASIIMSIMVHLTPSLEKINKEGEEGRRKITQYTRYLTVLIALIQSLATAIWLEQIPYEIPIVLAPGIGFKLLTMLVMTTGALFVMWLGEQITGRGIGNGSSIIIFSSIVAGLPQGFSITIQQVLSGEMNIVRGILILAIIALIIGGVVIMIQGHRKISVQYAKRIIGRRVYSGQSSYLPLQINMAGVIPIIFASSILMFPATIGAFLGTSGFSDWLLYIPGWVREGFTNLLYAGLTIFFTYFYISIIFNPNEVAENLRKNGGFIPGIRPGKQTADYLHVIINRITFIGAIFLAIIAVVPFMILSSVRAPFLFDGTSILIIVGVALDTLRQLESHLIMHHYEGFLKKARIRGRF